MRQRPRVRLRDASDGGEAACSNGVHVAVALAEQKLLGKLTEEMLSPEGLAIVERRLREHLRQPGQTRKEPPKAQAARIAQKDAEIANLRRWRSCSALRGSIRRRPAICFSRSSGVGRESSSRSRSSVGSPEATLACVIRTRSCKRATHFSTCSEAG